MPSALSELPLEFRDASQHSSAVSLEFRLTRAAHRRADPCSLLGELAAAAEDLRGAGLDLLALAPGEPGYTLVASRSAPLIAPPA